MVKKHILYIRQLQGAEPLFFIADCTHDESSFLVRVYPMSEDTGITR